MSVSGVISEEFVQTLLNSGGGDYSAAHISRDDGLLRAKDVLRAIRELKNREALTSDHTVYLPDGLPVVLDDPDDATVDVRAFHGVPVQRVEGMTTEYVLVANPHGLHLSGVPEWGDDVAVISDFDNSVAYQ